MFGPRFPFSPATSILLPACSFLATLLSHTNFPVVVQYLQYPLRSSQRLRLRRPLNRTPPLAPITILQY